MIDKLTQLVPDIEFCPGEKFCWSPQEQKITYFPDQIEAEGRWALLHETGHALLKHLVYKTDYELLRMEIDAWEKAKELAHKLGLEITEDHIQECLDSYRDWLYSRCICPDCGTKTLQNDLSNSYSCYNCHACWQVTPSRFCRAYRSIKHEQENYII